MVHRTHQQPKAGAGSLKQKAHEEILQRILAGQFAPGDLLNRRSVAREFGMSTAPVHEAMLQLEREGFLEALPRLGTRVRLVTREDVRGNMVLREALECQAVRMISGERIRRAQRALAPLAAAADQQGATMDKRARAEVAFHLALVELAGCEALAREYRRVMRIGLFHHINSLMEMPVLAPADCHGALLRKLTKASPDAAEAAMRAHIWSGKPQGLRETDAKE